MTNKIEETNKALQVLHMAIRHYNNQNTRNGLRTSHNVAVLIEENQLTIFPAFGKTIHNVPRILTLANALCIFGYVTAREYKNKSVPAIVCWK